jgi:Formin Homology 2 Domain
MIEVNQAAEKFDSLLFRSQFQVRLDELLESVGKVERACDEVHASEKLQRMMGMILTLVNQINTGGDGNEAAGFTLDALPKLNEVSS